MKRALAMFSVCFFLCLGIFAQMWLSGHNPVKIPSVGSGVIASLGGLRSIASEVVWSRADRLERQGRFGELVQLASMLTFLEPHVTEVWTYSAWNLSHNISLRMPRNEDKWFWVRSAIEMLRDEALKWNPGDPDICYELACLFELKIGHKIDVAAPLYRDEWRKIVEDVKRRDAWHELSMDRAEMAEVERLYGVEDWTNPQSSAIYWARQGLAKSDERDRARLEYLIRQAEMLYKKTNRKEKL